MESKVDNNSDQRLGNDPRISKEEFAARAISILEDVSNKTHGRFQSLAKSIFLIPHACMSLGMEESEKLRVRMVDEVVEVDRKGSFCGMVMDRSEILVVQNALVDENFRDNPLVQDKMQIRFYAGVPLHREDEMPFGTLCVMDTIPRTFDEGRLTILRDLGRQVVEHLEIEVRNQILSGDVAESLDSDRSRAQADSKALPDKERAVIADSVVSLEDELERIFDLFSSEANAKGVELISNVSKDLRVDLERDILWMVLKTTIFNGIKYCILGGSVRVEAWKSARHLLVSVSDTGAGMPVGKVQEVMGESPIMSGLVACRRLLESNNGQMDILTEKGMGTTVTLTIPVG